MNSLKCGNFWPITLHPFHQLEAVHGYSPTSKRQIILPAKLLHDEEITNQSVCQILQCGASDESDQICGCSIPRKYPTNRRNNVKKYHPAQFVEVLAKEEKEKKEKEIVEKTKWSKIFEGTLASR